MLTISVFRPGFDHQPVITLVNYFNCLTVFFYFLLTNHVYSNLANYFDCLCLCFLPTVSTVD